MKFSRAVVYLLITTLLIALPKAQALDVSVGSGYTSAFSGRRIPILYLGLIGQNLGVSAYSAGVKSSLYYHSAYQGNVFAQKNFGRLIWGDLTGGAGVGYFTAIRSYRSYMEDSSTREKDHVIGPMIRSSWNLFLPVHLTIEALFGVRGLQAVFNSFQHVTTIVLELRF